MKQNLRCGTGRSTRPRFTSRTCWMRPRCCLSQGLREWDSLRSWCMGPEGPWIRSAWRCPVSFASTAHWNLVICLMSVTSILKLEFLIQRHWKLIDLVYIYVIEMVTSIFNTHLDQLHLVVHHLVLHTYKDFMVIKMGLINWNHWWYYW